MEAEYNFISRFIDIIAILHLTVIKLENCPPTTTFSPPF